MIILLLLYCLFFPYITTATYATAIDALKKEVFKNPYKIEHHEHLIKVLIQEKKYNEADQYMNDALRLFNQPTSLLYLKAALHIEQNQIEQAAATLDIKDKIAPIKYCHIISVGVCLFCTNMILLFLFI